MKLWRTFRSYVLKLGKATSDDREIDQPEGIPRGLRRIERVELDPKSPVTMLDGVERPPYSWTADSKKKGRADL